MTALRRVAGVRLRTLTGSTRQDLATIGEQVRPILFEESYKNHELNSNPPDFWQRQVKETAWRDRGNSLQWQKEGMSSMEIGQGSSQSTGFSYGVGTDVRALQKRNFQLSEVKQIHARLMKAAKKPRLFELNSLMDMYVKCGSMEDARQVFDGLPKRSVVSWNIMILGYVKRQEGELALELYARMLKEGVEPSDRTFVGILKACSSLAMMEEGTVVDGNTVKARYLEEGRAIQSQVVTKGCESDVFVGNTLIDMYVKCGSMVDAHSVFDKLPHRDVVSWNAMILGRAQRDEAEVTLQLYASMQEEGIAPDNRTFVGALKACCSLAAVENVTEVGGKVVKVGSLEKGRTMHWRVVQSAVEPDEYVGNTLIDMYVKCGSMVDAQRVFDELPYRGIVSWNALILGYALNEEGEVALRLYAQMQEQGLIPDERTFIGALKACSSLSALEAGIKAGGQLVKIRSLDQGRAIHSHSWKLGFQSNVYVGNTLIDMYAKCGSMVDAQHVFDKLPRRSVVSWTAMILGYAEKEEADMALELYAQMEKEGVAPNDRTFVGVLKAIGSLAQMEEGKEVDGKLMKLGCLEKVRAIHSQAAKSGFVSDIYVQTSLVDMYAKCGSILDARRVFDELVPHLDLVPWNAMILGYSEQGESEDAFELYKKMQEKGLCPNSWTFVSILKACCSSEALETGKEIHAQVIQARFEATTIVATSLIDMYGKCGSMVDAQRLFDALPTRDLVLWNALIAGYARQGESERVFALFERMKQEGLQPDRVTFLSVLAVCSHDGLVEKGQEYFRAMHKDYDIPQTIEHYNCMVDLFGRAGRLNEAVATIETMPFQPNLVTWKIVLGACQKWKGVQLGRHAFECATRLDEDHAAAYVLMANIYAGSQMWEDRDKIQAMRMKALARKKPGQSS